MTGTPRPPAIFDRAFLTGRDDITLLTLVRHGEQFVTDPRSAAVGEWVDPPLSDRGRLQARLVGERLSTDRVEAVYSSPLRRALETAVEIARHHRLEPVVMPDLREVEIFRDIPADQTATQFLGEPLLTGIRERMLAERSWDVYPYSEEAAAFRKRVVNALEAIVASHENQRVVVACHGGVINAYIAHMIGTKYDMFFRPAHTSVHVVAASEGIRALQTLNDIHHLKTAEGDFLSH